MTEASELASSFLRYMNGIQRCEAQLSSLDEAWEHIKRLAEVTCPEEAKTILPSMERTQSEFKDLQGRLIENLVMENFRKASLELASKAQVSVDILIRNLFERTADVGFLATDDDIRDFLSEESPSEERCEFIRRRLQDYVAKYTVYEEIVLLDCRGIVRANLDSSNPIVGKLLEDPLIAATTASDAPYIETFRRSCLQPAKPQSLIYSKRVTAPGDDSKIIGALCLCFKFEDELKGIFKGLRKEGDKCSLFILDAAGSAIASSDPRFIPVGTEMELASGDELKIVDIAGREYLACTRRTKGYQGYCGLGWMGHALIPCDAAFKAEAKAADSSQSALSLGSSGFSHSLSDIVGRADMINLGLRRVVWNGQVMAGGSDGSKLKPVLAQISKTGAKTISLFSDSIRDLRSTVVSSSLSDAKAHARLAIDIMDRNLYERSDDCRWWALNSEFRRMLSKDSLEPEDLAAMSKTLAYVNGLYTVYSGLFLYDRSGKVAAVSNDSLSPFLGRVLDEEFARRTLQVNESQRYTVSSFVKSPLYGGRHTYVYGAPVIELDGARRTVGGIGIVFDSEPQFEAMLLDALPSKDGGCGVFADRDGNVISSTVSSLKPGSKLELDPAFFKLPNGEGLSRIVEFGGKLCIAGCVCSSGYREYKNSGDYKNDVLAFIFVELCDAKDAKASSSASVKARAFEDAAQNGAAKRKSGTKAVELATFFINGRRMAFEKDAVVESLPCERMTCGLPGAAEYLEGTLTYRDEIVPVINMRVVCGFPKKTPDIYTQIVIVRLSQGEFMGALVDDLDAVPEFPEDMVQPVPSIVAGDSGYVKKLVKCHEGSNEMTLVLDPDLVLSSARRGSHPNGTALPGASKRSSNGRSERNGETNVHGVAAPALTLVKAAAGA